MARMHNGKKGKSSSTKPLRTEVPEWTGLQAEEITTTAVRLAKEGHTPSHIGMILRDQYAVPDVKLATGKSITTLLAENGAGLEMPQDLMDLMRKAVSLDKHLEGNKKDLHNTRGLRLTEAKIRRLGNYYKRTGILPGDWKYTMNMAKLTVD